MAELQKIMKKRRQSIEAGSIDPNIQKLESSSFSSSSTTTTPVPENELEKKLARRRRLSEASPDSALIQKQLSKIENRVHCRASFSKPNQQLKKIFKKTNQKIEHANAVKKYAGDSNMEQLLESDIDKQLKKKQFTTGAAAHYDQPSNELETKLRKRRQSMTQSNSSDVKQKKKKECATVPSSASSFSSPTSASATPSSSIPPSTFAQQSTQAGSSLTSNTNESNERICIAFFLLLLLGAAAYLLKY